MKCPKCETEIPPRRGECPNCGAANPEVCDGLPGIVIKAMNDSAERKLHPENYANITLIQNVQYNIHRHESPFAGLLTPPDTTHDDKTLADPFGLFLSYTAFGLILLFTALSQDFCTAIFGGMAVFLLIVSYRLSPSKDKRRHGTIMIFLGILWAIELCAFLPDKFYPGATL